jgi:hypothetical protein
MVRAGNDILSVRKQAWKIPQQALYGDGRTAKHPFLGYHIKHSLSSVFFAAEMQESGKVDRGYIP